MMKPSANYREQYLTQEEYRRFSILLNERLGIAWKDSEVKKEQLGRRIDHHMRLIGIADVSKYYNYLLQEENLCDLQYLYNTVTITMTKFFRERKQLEFLEKEVFGQLNANHSFLQTRKLRIWSAGCASGEEAYTLAMLADEHLGTLGWDIRILASDINTEVLSEAKAGIYSPEEVKHVPVSFMEKYFEKGRHKGKMAFRIKPELKRFIQFRVINLLSDRYPIKTRFGMIFCRNVLIYFDQENQSALLQRFRNLLDEDGFLFLGHSEFLESISGFKRLRLNVYQKQS